MSGIARAITFNCAGGDVTCLIISIQLANAAGGDNQIYLGSGTYHLTSVDNNATHGPNGLPVITSSLVLHGSGMSPTILQRDYALRAIEVSSTGMLYLASLTIQGSAAEDTDLEQWGGLGLLNFGTASLFDIAIRGIENEGDGLAINNRGNLSLTGSLIDGNRCDQCEGAGISSEGTMQINRSTIRNNETYGSGGGIEARSGTITIIGSSITNNYSRDGGGIETSGNLTIRDSTIAENGTDSGDGGGGIRVTGGLTRLIYCTVADNSVNTTFATGGGGILNRGGTVELQDTILARNTWFHGFDNPPFSTPWDCAGAITSIGNNIVGSTFGCTTALRSTDHLGDAGLGVFTDQIPAADGWTQGNGQIPLLSGSAAIDGGDPATSGSHDQLGKSIVDGNVDGAAIRDIGAVEFKTPIVKNLVFLDMSKSKLSSTPVPNGPAGTATISAILKNTSAEPIYAPFLSLHGVGDGALLLTADQPPGGVGSRQTPNVGADVVLSPGEQVSFTIVFGLQRLVIPKFAFDVLGGAGATSP
ncbi:MAG TPA: right-handed parallel beta-helix repeat-containing protein [Thermoanaerobaculia bacterium]